MFKPLRPMQGTRDVLVNMDQVQRVSWTWNNAETDSTVTLTFREGNSETFRVGKVSEETFAEKLHDLTDVMVDLTAEEETSDWWLSTEETHRLS